MAGNAPNSAKTLPQNLEVAVKAVGSQRAERESGEMIQAAVCIRTARHIAKSFREDAGTVREKTFVELIARQSLRQTCPMTKTATSRE